MPIYSVFFDVEKNILFSLMDLIENGNKHKYLITLFEVVKACEEIYINQIYQFTTEHKDIIVSIFGLKINFI